MHPTFSQYLVDDRHATLRAEADRSRLAHLARNAGPAAPTSAPSGVRRARPGIVRRLVLRLTAT